MPNFDEISQSTAEIKLLSVSESGPPPYWNYIFGFDFDLCIVIDIDVEPPIGRTSLLGGQYRTIASPILSPQTAILGQEVLKTHANIK